MTAAARTIVGVHGATGGASDLGLPFGPKVTRKGDIAFLGVGPERWLAVRPGRHPDLANEIARLLPPVATLVDLTDAYSAFAVRGPAVRDVLSRGVTIDLHSSVFGEDDVAVTSVAGIDVILWMFDAQPVFELFVFRSLAGSFWHWLETSGAPFGIEVVPPPA